MKLEDQVCTLQQAQKLKELGVECDSIFWWNQETERNQPIVTRDYTHIAASSTKYWRAYTVAELGVMLPYEICDGNYQVFDFEDLGKHDTDCFVFNRNKTFFKAEAQARASALIWLIENKHLDPTEINIS